MEYDRASRPTLSGAMLHHWPVVLVVTLAVVAGSVFYASTKPPTASAEARLLVASIDVKPEALPAAAAAANSLAGTYSRLMETEPVMLIVAQKLGLTPEQVQGRLRATPVPESSIVRIIATAPTSEEAVRLADTGSDALQQFVTSFGAPAGDAVLARWDEASKALVAAQTDFAAKQTALAKAQTTGTPAELGAAQAAAIQSQSAVDRAKLQLDSIAQQYQTNTQDASQGIGGLRSLGSAVLMGTDSKQRLQGALITGLLLGVALGAAISYALETRRLRRRAATSAPRPERFAGAR